MEEFLHSLLITKSYEYNGNIFKLSKEIKIIIEIQNGYNDLLQKFPILSLFPIQKISINNLPIVSNEIDSNIQINANYLRFGK